MLDVMNAETLGELTEVKPSCFEIANLQDVFKKLISNKKFSNNDFLKQQSDVLAVLDLAEACNLFDGINYEAAGVCYNNIANFQLK